MEASSTTAGDQYDDYYNGNVAYDDEATNQRRSNADFEICKLHASKYLIGFFF